MKLFTSGNLRRVEFNGEVNHVHLLIDYPPQVQLSKLIANLKTVSSRLIRLDFTDHIQQFHNSHLALIGRNHEKANREGKSVTRVGEISFSGK